MGSRKKKQKRDKKKRSRAHKPGRPVFGSMPGDVVIVSPPGAEKMSEVLMEFVEPYSDQWNTVEELGKLLSMAVIAWNAALYPLGKREEFLQDMLQAVPPGVRPEMRVYLDEMIQRKLRHFAYNKRLIVNYDVTMTPAGPHVSVMSTLGSE